MRDTSTSCLLHAPNWGPGPQPRHVPWLGIELVTLWFTGRHSIHWVTPARVQILIYKDNWATTQRGQCHGKQNWMLFSFPRNERLTTPGRPTGEAPVRVSHEAEKEWAGTGLCWGFHGEVKAGQGKQLRGEGQPPAAWFLALSWFRTGLSWAWCVESQLKGVVRGMSSGQQERYKQL